MSKMNKYFDFNKFSWHRLFFSMIWILPGALFGYLLDMSVTPQTRVVNQSGYQIFQFTTTASIPANGRIVIVYHPDFILGGVSSASSSTMDGSFSVSLSGSSVILTRSGGTATSPGVENIQVSVVHNPIGSGTYYYTVRTEDSGGSEIEDGSFSDFIYAAALHHFSFTGVPSTANAGSSIGSDIVVTARDQYNNRKSDYSSSVIWSSSDPYPATVPTDDGTGWTSGRKTFSASGFVFYTKGTQTLTVEDGAITNTTGDIEVESGSAAEFTLSCPSPQTAGTAFSLTVTDAEDAWENSFTGTVNIDVFSGGENSPGGNPPTIPAQIVVTDGSGSVSGVILTNAVTTQFRGTSNGTVSLSSPIAVHHAGLVDFDLSAGSPVNAGEAFDLDVTNAEDGYGNPWSGTITVDASQGGGDSPDGTPPSFNNISVTEGAGTQQQTLYNTENTVLRGQSGGVVRETGMLILNPGVSLHELLLTGMPASITAGETYPSVITVTAKDAFGNIKTNYSGSIYFESSDDPLAWFEYDSSNLYSGPYINGSVTLDGSNFIMRTAGLKSMTVVDTGPGNVSETKTVNVETAAIADFNISCAGIWTAGEEERVYITNAQDAFSNPWSGTVSITATQGGGNSPYGAQPVFNDIYVGSDGEGDNGQQLVLKETGVELQAQAGSVTRLRSGISVLAGDLASLKIRDEGGGGGNVIKTLSMVVGQSFTFYSAGYDFYGNYREDESCDWTGSETLGTVIDASDVSNFSFVPEAPGYGDITAAAVSDNSVSDNTGTITVESGALHHFTFDFVSTQIKDIKGQIEVTARDANDNVVTSFNGIVDLTDLTGKVEPKQLGTPGSEFKNGVWTDNITFSEVLYNNQLTVEAAGGETGQSNLFDVVEGPGCRIIQFQKLQDDTSKIINTLTVNQERDWFVKMKVENFGSFTLRMDSVRLKLEVDEVVQNDYTIQYPTTFWGNGSNLLTGGSIDSLLIKVDVSGHVSGTLNLEGSIHLIDINSGKSINPDDVSTSLNAQTPALLSIPEIRLSREEVTWGQQLPWNVTLVVHNSGESEVRIDSDIMKTGISFDLGNNWMIEWPENMAGGDWILGGKESESILYSISQTGEGELGYCHVQAFISGQELNTHRALSLNVTASNTVLIEAPPLFQIVSVQNMAENAPKVNKNEVFPIAVRIRNSGSDAILDATLNFNSTKGSILQTSLPYWDIISRNQSIDVNAQVKAASGQTTNEIISVGGEGTADNTGFDLSSMNPLDDSCLVVIQEPAKFEVVSVTHTAPSQLMGGQVDEWKVKVAVRNPSTNANQGNLILHPPNSTDIRFFIGEEMQEDYTVIAPEALYSGGLMLRPNDMIDTLTYRITATGRKGGDVTIHADLSGTDENKSSRQLDASGTADISVIAEEKLKIMSTTVEAFHMVSEVAYVNTNQGFDIFVTVENGLGQSIKNVIVKLSQNGQSAIKDSVYRWIQALSPSEEATVKFSITASLNPRLSGELFTASIHSAQFQLSGNPVNPGKSPDSTAKAIIQSPAKLMLTLSSPRNVYSTGQIFSFTADVQNLGDADIDKSGILKIDIPLEYYSLISTDTLHLKSNDQLTWQIQAPSEALSAQPFTVSWYYPPVDLNTGSRDVVSGDANPVYITTIGSYINTNLAISSPAGALDDTLSTDQFFTVQAIVDWGNARDIFTTLQLPEGYIKHSQLHQSVDFESSTQLDTVFWLIQAPSEASDPANIQVSTSGKDAIQTDVTVSGSPATPVTVTTVPQAALGLSMAIISPIDAKDGSLSPGSVFTIQAAVTNTGVADTLGPTIVSIQPLPKGYSTPDGVLEKPLQDGTVTWDIKAPSLSSISASKIESKFFQLPLDENTNNSAAVLPNQGSYIIPVTTESYLLEIAQDSLASIATSVIPGQEDVKMMTLTFDNRSLRGGNKVTVNALRFDIEDRFNNPVDNPGDVISYASIVNEENPDEFFGGTADIPSTNPVVIQFSPLLLVSVDGNPRVSILVDIKNDVNIKYFKLNVKDNSYISARDSESAFPVPVIGKDEEEWTNMRSDAKYIYNPETESNLWSCPNPFSEQTTINYYLSESGDVQFKIFTLAGDLVWSVNLPNTSSGPRTITWDGCNGQGHRVMNGVYWLFMQTEAGVEAKFKIAVVK